MSEANQPKKRATFIATIRIDIRDLAKLARFLNNRGIYVDTRSKIASEALRIMARGTPDGQDITTLEKAIYELEMLGYSETLKQDSRYHNALFDELEIEKTSKTKQQDQLKVAKEYIEEKARQLKNKQNAQTTITQAENVTGSPLVSKEALTELDGTGQEAEEYNQRIKDDVIDPTKAKAGIKTKTSSADLADIDQKSSDDAQGMRAELGKMPDSGECSEPT